ncbi:peptide ABC transporter permease [Nocardiopsis sp. TSRI0078]|uniref:ABC transporter permease n=1 Tax=unclassified Nocardiopsis TaxID=2649073 RepID=UPI00093BAFAC|nr:ABC transporter permease [Nocardiopsis sp. TSRI0078]OKI15221.1 peptide ABC transporter permease [Nocardiopsis sp. TSRI0078]
MSTPSTAVARSAAARTRRAGLLRGAWGFGRTKLGVVLTGLVVLVAVAGPFVAPYTPTEFVAKPFETGVDGTVFGGDNRGRDVLTRFLWGGWTLLLLAGSAAGIGVVAGAVVGVVAGYQRGWLDDVVMRANDVLLAFPQLIAALLVMSVLGPKVWLIVAVIAVSHMPRVARVVREATRKVIEQDYVKAAEAIGLPRWRIMAVEILPNVTSPLLVELGLRLTYSIGVVAVLGFLGMGLQPPTADWGLMINENRQGMAVQPWAVALPVSAIAVLTIGVNLITDGLSRAAIGIDRGVGK